MKTFWQVRRAAFARALRAIASSATRTPRHNQTAHPPRNHWRSIGTVALTGAILLLTFGAAQAVGTGTTTINLNSSPNPSGIGQSVTFKGTVNNPNSGVIPTGTVTLMDGGNAIGSGTLAASPVGAQFNISATFNTGGTHSITAVYGGDNNFASNTSAALIQTVLQSTTTNLVASPNPSQPNQSVTFTATVSGSGGSPTGTVTFTDLSAASTISTVMITTVGGQQQASVTISFAAVSTHNIQAVYNGDSNFSGSTSNTVSQQVTNGTPTTTNLVASPTSITSNQQVTFTATIAPTSGSGAPTGTVHFTDTNGDDFGTITIQTVGGKQQASVTTTALSAGSSSSKTFTILATYSGDANFAGSSANLNLVVSASPPTTTTLVASPTSITSNQQVTFTATVAPQSGSGAPTGTVHFTDAWTPAPPGRIFSPMTRPERRAAISPARAGW